MHSESPLIHLPLITAMRTQMKGAGFGFLRTLCFPQPCYPSGWWSCTMAKKAANADFNFRIDDARAPRARRARRARGGK